jgi:caa(3)-type oxidase subunit IV
MADSHEDMRKHVTIYYKVFAALCVLTIVTVAVANFHLAIGLAVVVAIVIAVVKGSLVGGFFMHVIGERRIIIWTLFLVAALFVPLLALPLWTSHDTPFEAVSPVIFHKAHAEEAGGDHAPSHAEDEAGAADANEAESPAQEADPAADSAPEAAEPSAAAEEPPAEMEEPAAEAEEPAPASEEEPPADTEPGGDDEG